MIIPTGLRHSFGFAGVTGGEPDAGAPGDVGEFSIAISIFVANEPDNQRPGNQQADVNKGRRAQVTI
jgi:hypothetical protein